jgi:predicted short-subunit dehydrogenase-like oxidoreductase (DUF2520 family)
MKEGDSMRIGFIGAGRVGFTLGRYLTEHGISVTGYYSRSIKSAKEAAEFTDTLYYEKISDILKDSDVLFLTVSDNAISEVYENLKQYDLKGKILCHTSGALSSSVFTDSEQTGVYGYSIHPIYAVNDKLTAYRNFHHAFITIEGHEKYLATLQNMFTKMGNCTAIISGDNKVKYHAAAVCASNLVCGLYDMAERMLESCGFDRVMANQALRGLFLDNAEAVCKLGAEHALTGPVERNDSETIASHLEVLSGKEAETYRALSRETLELARRKNPDRDYSDTEAILGKD